MEPHDDYNDDDDDGAGTASSNVPADWEATCLFYSDAKTLWRPSKHQANNNNNNNNSSRRSSNSNSTASLPLIGGYGSIDIPIAVKEITFARYERAYGDDFANMHYRFWTCCCSGNDTHEGGRRGPLVRLEFEYTYNNKPENENNESEGGDAYYEYDDEDGGDTVFPRNATVSLLSDYPPSWPQAKDTNKNNRNSYNTAAQRWIEWMDQKANEMLKQQKAQEQEERVSSFEVCSYLERCAIVDYFDVVHEDDCSANCLVLFPDSRQERDTSCGTTTSRKSDPLHHHYCYETETFIVNLQSQEAFMRHQPTVGKAAETSSISEYFTKQTLPDEARERILPFITNWRKWVKMAKPCPICFDRAAFDDVVTINTCGHDFCRDCLSTYLSVQVQGLYEHRDNPFRCPSCRYSMQIIGFVKKFLSAEEMDKVRAWYKHLKHPPCYSLTQCLSKKCQAVGSLRKQAIDSYLIFCEECDGKWCELCLKRLYNADTGVPNTCTNNKGKNASSCVDNSKTSSNDASPHANGGEDCKAERTAKFCQRYLKASDEAKRECEEKWPWIKIYANSRVHDSAVVDWLVQQGHGQVCPVCKTGVERIEGCFHISCTCGCHFCYECGEEIFYPFYGTHHCWEQREDAWQTMT